MIKKIVITGGGTAGWMTAAALGKLYGHVLDIVLIESEDIGTIGVGEATVPPLHHFHDFLELDEQEFMRETDATFKLGIEFSGWGNKDSQYIHPFGELGRAHWSTGFQAFWRRGKDLGVDYPIGDYCLEHVAAEAGRFYTQKGAPRNYAYHLDAGKYAKFLRKYAEQRGVQRIEGMISEVETQTAEGIKGVVLASGRRIAGDFFIDCSGFRSILLGQALETRFEDWSEDLPCDSAVAVQSQLEQRDTPPYTRSTAHPWGWQWAIPLQSRMGNGLVYSSKYVSDEEARNTLCESIKGKLLTEPKVIRFTPGTREVHWKQNCVAVGLAGSFVEPLESTAIHMIQSTILKLVRMFPVSGVNDDVIAEFNRLTRDEMLKLRDFILMHYVVNGRQDSQFWIDRQNQPVPKTLAERLRIYKDIGTVYPGPNDLFSEKAWVFVLTGQGLISRHFHASANMMSEAELVRFLATARSHMSNIVQKWPTHQQFIDRYCSPPVKDPVEV